MFPSKRGVPFVLGVLLVALALLSSGVPLGAAKHNGWPALEDAVIRPGVQLQIEGRGFCTSNFVYKNASNDKLYIGMAGHCAGPFHGANVRLPDDLYWYARNTGLAPDQPVIGTVAYSSWFYRNVNTEPCLPPVTVLSCATGNDGGDDFALVEINDDYHDLVHPAVLHFGGPTGIATWADVQVNDLVITYGNSPLRPGPEQLDWHYGLVSRRQPPDTVWIRTLGPGVPGDSGSGVMLFDGLALGTLVTLDLFGGTNGVAFLEHSLSEAAKRDVHVELQTWPLLNGGL